MPSDIGARTTVIVCWRSTEAIFLPPAWRFRMAWLRMWPRAFITPHRMKVEAFLFSEFSFEHPLSSDCRMLSA